MTTSAPLIVESLDEVKPVDGGWVYLRGDKVYVAQGGKWVPYAKSPPPDLWSHLTSDEDDTDRPPFAARARR
jgi:hypothetical protein